MLETAHSFLDVNLGDVTSIGTIVAGLWRLTVKVAELRAEVQERLTALERAAFNGGQRPDIRRPRR